jgi:hypothetical protein
MHGAAFQQPWGAHRANSNPSRNASRRGSLAALHEKELDSGSGL